MGKPLKLGVIHRMKRFRGIGLNSPYDVADYCNRCGWVPLESIVQGRSGEARCPRCGQRVRTRPRSEYKPARMRKWRRTN